MRMLIPVLAVLAIVAAGCGSGPPATAPTQTTAGPIARTSYSRALASLCDRTRVRFEGLGKPIETPPAELLPGTVLVVRSFMRELRALHPSTVEKARAKRLARLYGLWSEGERYALVAIKQGNTTAFVNLQEGADHWLGRAERVAVALGANECQRRPFESP